MAEESGTEAGPAAPAQVDFYVVDAPGDEPTYRIACRVAEKAWQAGHRVHVLAPSDEALRLLDDLLWTFRQESFVPHERAGPDAAPPEAPVVLSLAEPHDGEADLLINLTRSVPACAGSCRRLAEMVAGDEPSREAGRLRYRHYRDAGCEPRSHRV